MNVPFGEGAVLNDGRRVSAVWQSRGIYVGPVFHDGPILLMPDAALTPLGRIWVCGRSQPDDLARVWLDSVGLWWTVPYKLYGTRMVLRADGEGCRIAFTTTATNWLCLAVTPGGSMSVVESGVIPNGDGGMGMRDWTPAGSPRPLSPLDQSLLGHQVRTAVTVGDTTIAAADGQVVIARTGALGTLQQGEIDWPTPRLSANGKWWSGVRYVGEVACGGPVPAVVPPLASPPPAPIVSVGRPCWLGFFNFVPHTTPGNCTLNVSDLVVRDARGAAVALFVEGKPDGDLAAINRAIASAKSLGLPVIAYWPKALQKGPLPTGMDWLGVEAYCFTDSLSSFEARVRAAVARHPKVMLVCQCCDNGSPTTPLTSLVPVYARIAKDCKNVGGLLVFSGYGRSTGLQDHPEVLPLWVLLAAGIPAAPPKEDDVNVPGTDVPTTLPKIVKGQRWDLTVKDRNNPGFSTRFLIDEAGKLTVTLTNPAGSNPTGLPRQVL